MVSSPWAMSAATVASAVVMGTAVPGTAVGGPDRVAAVISGFQLEPAAGTKRPSVQIGASVSRAPLRGALRALTSGRLHEPFRATLRTPDQPHAPLSLPYLRRAARGRYRPGSAAFRLVPSHPRPW